MQTRGFGWSENLDVHVLLLSWCFGSSWCLALAAIAIISFYACCCTLSWCYISRYLELDSHSTSPASGFAPLGQITVAARWLGTIKHAQCLPAMVAFAFSFNSALEPVIDFLESSFQHIRAGIIRAPASFGEYMSSCFLPSRDLLHLWPVPESPWANSDCLLAICYRSLYSIQPS
jgi:hypothetical protein